MTDRSASGRRAHETRKAGEKLQHARESAQHCFARASALLTDHQAESHGEALFWGALGVLRLAQSDPEHALADQAEKILRFFSGKSERGPGPYSGT